MPQLGPREPTAPSVEARKHLRDNLVYDVLTEPRTTKALSDLLALSMPAVRQSLRRLATEHRVHLSRTDGVFLWERTTSPQSPEFANE